MKAVTPEGYTFVTKFQEDNSHKVLRSVDFFSIKFDEIFFDTVCWEAPIRGGNPHRFFFRGGGRGSTLPPPPSPLLLAHMIKSDYKMRNNFEKYLSHNYVKIHSRLHLIELFLKNFLGRAYPQIL